MKIAYSFILFLFLIGCKQPQSFELQEFKNFKLEKLGADQSQVAFELTYFNPNNYKVDLKRVDCEVYINDSYLGKYILDTVMVIPKKDTFNLPSRMQIDMKNVFKNAFTSIFNREIKLTLKGTTRVGKAGIYMNLPIEYEGRHQIPLFK